MRKILLAALLALPLAAYAVGIFLAVGGSSGGGGPNDHFDSEVSRLTGLGDLVDSNSLRNDTVIEAVANGSWTGAQVDYDSTEDAAEFHYDITTPNPNADFPYPQFSGGVVNSGNLWCQFEVMLGSSNAELSDTWGLNTHKAIVFRQESSAIDKRRFEMRWRYDEVDGSTVAALVDFRTYQDENIGGTGSDQPLLYNNATFTDQQPGDDVEADQSIGRDWVLGDHLSAVSQASPFLMQFDVWIQFTVDIAFSDVYRTGDQYDVRVWASDEDNDAVLILNAPGDPNTGFATGNLADDAQSGGITGVAFQWNTSSTPGSSHTINAWVRNYICADSEITTSRPIQAP